MFATYPAVGSKGERRGSQPSQGSTVTLTCDDGVVLGANLWRSSSSPLGQVIINPATGVLARFYHRYARFLANHGFEVLTYDYRGIGASRPSNMKGCGYRWRDWGERDFEAALRFMLDRSGSGPLTVVGHSIGGFLPGLARSATAIDRMLTVGAQYAWWGDYALRRRAGLFVKWHVVMPMLTAASGYFPGRRLGWLEDLPAGVANEWSFRGPRFERSHPSSERQSALDRFAAVTAPILAVMVTDDELGTPQAIRRTLAYYTAADRKLIQLAPSDFGARSIGHFGLFHDRHKDDFWIESLNWIRDGIAGYSVI